MRVITIAMNEYRNISGFADEALLSEVALKRCSSSFEELYSRYEVIVYNKCLGFSSNYPEAEDLTQDVFVKLFLSAHKFKGQSKFSSWFYSLTYNHCVNYLNRDKEKKIQDHSVSTSESDFEIEDVKDEIIFEHNHEALAVALKNIKPEEKAILLLKYQDETSIKDLANILEIGESAVKMRIKRAKAKLLEQLTKIELKLQTTRSIQL